MNYSNLAFLMGLMFVNCDNRRPEKESETIDVLCNHKVIDFSGYAIGVDRPVILYRTRLMLPEDQSERTEIFLDRNGTDVTYVFVESRCGN